ncbi:AGAP010332-PA, partial [Anopheles gambiae str. PEST]
MMEKLYKTCCRLCLHDGSTQQLLDILSVKGLKENISNIFNIEIDTRDCCTTNVCLNCFNETLSMEKEFQLYEEQKRIILANQLRLQENPSEATSELASSALASSVACIEGDAGGKKSVNAPERSRKAPKVAPYNLNSKKDQSMKTQRISIDPVDVNLEETKNQQNKSITKTIKDKT